MLLEKFDMRLILIKYEMQKNRGFFLFLPYIILFFSLVFYFLFTFYYIFTYSFMDYCHQLHLLTL